MYVYIADRQGHNWQENIPDGVRNSASHESFPLLTFAVYGIIWCLRFGYITTANYWSEMTDGLLLFNNIKQ